MRVSPACALFAAPQIPLLDEPTNYLDLGAVLWLESYPATAFDDTLPVVSHGRSFPDAVGTTPTPTHTHPSPSAQETPRSLPPPRPRPGWLRTMEDQRRLAAPQTARDPGPKNLVGGRIMKTDWETREGPSGQGLFTFLALLIAPQFPCRFG